MINLKVAAVAMLLCGLLVAGGASAAITVYSTYMDFQGIDPDPSFDLDGSPIVFTQTTASYLSVSTTDSSRWFFAGQQSYTSDYTSDWTDSTWFEKTNSESYMNVDKAVVNSTGSSFSGYTITLHVATLVADSLTINGASFDATISTVTDSYGDVTTTISILFDTPIASGESFDLSYILDLNGVVTPPPDDGTYGIDEGGTLSDTVSVDEVAEAPEPATLTLLGLGAAALFARRRRV
ncbi:MAG: PEP-CTERM sorting domain-containing protein [Planctomycetaceae bacterium]|nr:PEP-CTERM sorting domain-containing protein [Planctomycetaceae bacterium]